MKNSTEKTFTKVVQYVGLAILTVVVLFAIFGDRSNCGIDRETLACMFTGSLWDILGILIFIAGALWIFGLGNVVSQKTIKKDVYIEEGVGSTYNSWIGFVGCLVGMGLIYIS